MSVEIHDGEPPQVSGLVRRLVAPSRLERKEVIIEQVMDFFDHQGWVLPADRHWLNLCLDEVVVNAMLHGNEGDPRIPIAVSIYDLGERWVIRVDDHGDGFDHTDIPDPDHPESLFLEHGRGILIMNEWLDQLHYYRDGATAWLVRRKSLPPPTTASDLEESAHD
jgi:anti-sigma regulatory factor (Ser/Thr protein kinase)